MRLITDGQSSVGVRYGPAGNSALAVLNGQGAGKPLAANLVPTNTPLTVGEVFTTSGLAGRQLSRRHPGGQRGGVARPGPPRPQESVTLEPLADLTHLRYVSVVLWGPSS